MATPFHLEFEDALLPSGCCRAICENKGLFCAKDLFGIAWPSGQLGKQGLGDLA